MLVSQRTSEELLTGEGKEKLAKDILREASLPFGGGGDESEDEVASDAGKKKKKKPATTYPVTQVLFSSLIIQ
jgi:flagellar FliL protein